MGKRLVWILLAVVLLCGCQQEAPEAAGEKDYELMANGYIYAGPDRVYAFQNNAPEFSLEGSFYADPIWVQLVTEKEAEIYYTLDCTDPDENSLRYDPREGLYFNCSYRETPEPYVIRARAYYPDGTVSGVSCHTYFCAPNITRRFTTAVFFISGDPAELTGRPDGIFYGENYHQRGDESERAVYIEAWDAQGQPMFSQHCGIRIYGGASRASSIKSTKLYARKRYGSDEGKFRTDIFGTPKADGSGIVEEYDKLVLRNAGNDFQFGFIRDEMVHTLAKQAGFSDYEAVVPAVVYLNGSYYGLFWLHESYCDDYFKNKYPNDGAEGEFVVAEGTERQKNTGEDGGKEVYAEAYNQMYDVYAYADLTDEKQYKALCGQVDVENYLAYCAFNIYINNFDWPQNNYKCYRYVPATGERFDGVYDGRWRYLLHDTDYSFHIYTMKEVSASYNNLKLILDPSSDRYAPLLDALLRRSDCRAYFLDTMTRLAEGALSGENVTQTLYRLHVQRCTEMDRFFEHMEALRKKGDDSFWTRPDVLAENMDNIRAFANEREAVFLPLVERTLEKYGD